MIASFISKDYLYGVIYMKELQKLWSKVNVSHYFYRINVLLKNCDKFQQGSAMEETFLDLMPLESFSSVQFISVAQSCRLCDPVNRSTPGLPVHHQLPEFTQTHVHRVSDATQPSHPLSSPSPPAPNSSQHKGLFQWDNSSHEVAKVLEFQL